ncbi:MAG: transferase [Desulfobacterales bacterium]|nr:transferase [Desulfobacterales bacterium]
MESLSKLIDRIINRVNINLRELSFEVDPYIQNVIPLTQLTKFYAFYGVSSNHPLYFNFAKSSLSGSYFLGKCNVVSSVLYKSDIRGDELKVKGDEFEYKGSVIKIDEDESIRIKDSYLIKTLVHSYSHDPGNPEELLIKNTFSSHYANIHGSNVVGCFLGPFSTVDLTTLHACIVGPFSYIQAENLYHHKFEPGTIWIKKEYNFEFKFVFDPNVLKEYIYVEKGKHPSGKLMEFVDSRKEDFESIYDFIQFDLSSPAPETSALNPYAVVKGDTYISDNVLVAQRAYLQEAWMGDGSNAQENSYIINSRLNGNNITAHGAKIINSVLSKNIFVGFNSFLYGKKDCPLTIGEGTIIMPHTIIDLIEPLNIPENFLVWGFIKDQNDLLTHSISFDKMSKVKDQIKIGNMLFKGNGELFISAFKKRIEHILEANGALYDENKTKMGHAQKGQKISYNTIQPYLSGGMKGIFPTMIIQP